MIDIWNTIGNAEANVDMQLGNSAAAAGSSKLPDPSYGMFRFIVN